MRFRSWVLIVGSVSALGLFACAAKQDETSNESDEINGSLSAAKACAVREAYEAAPLAAFTNDCFDVTGVGRVCVDDSGTGSMTFIAGDEVIASARDAGGGRWTWFTAGGAALVCGPSSSPDSGGRPDGGGLGDGGSVGDAGREGGGGISDAGRG